MTGPLEGFRIVDLTSVISGPLATMILADQGAEVIKVETPQGGDFTRASANRRGGFSASFVNNNRNKRSIALDLKNPKGLEALMAVVAGADVFIQNFRPGVVERLGVDEKAVRAARPDIVYVSISGFGHRGPLARRPVYDPLIQAISGLTTVQAGSDEVRPRLVRTILPDKLTGVTASQAVTAALLARERTGSGQHVWVSMLDSVIAFLWASDMGSQTFVGDELPQQAAQSFIDLIYETSDGYISVAVQTDKQWRGLTEALDRPEWLDDPRFETQELRQVNIDDRLGLTQEVLKTNSSAHWLARLEAVDIPCVPVLTRNQMISNEQIAANEVVIETEHPDAGKLRQARPAALFSGTPTGAPRPAPRLGADTEAVLGEAGFDAAEIAALREAGAFGRDPA